ncbi:MAG: hypothetical protein JSS83_21225 [Cyanobacteria bacterium SZAS LIN-3]|nr:hypothetical protein [Cyanobacteria bacterium SZAS LIN-3]
MATRFYHDSRPGAKAVARGSAAAFLAMAQMVSCAISCPGAPAASNSTAPAPSAEAERLYNEALQFYELNRFARAYDLGHQCCQLAPKNTRYRIALAVFESKDRALIYSLSSAKEAARLAPSDANAQTNFGILLQKNGQRADAVEAYKRAEALNPRDYRPKLGVAQCLSVDGTDGRVIAERELKAACETPEDSSSKWISLGTTYYVLRLFPNATACFTRALKLDPQNYELQVLRFKTALAERDSSTIKSMVEGVVSEKLVDKEAALGLALASDADVGPDLKHKLLAICEKNFFGQGDFFYQLGRNFETTQHLDMAYSAYQSALKFSPGESRFIVSMIGNRLAAGRADEAMTVFRQSSVEGKAEPNAPAGHGVSVPRDKSMFVHVLCCVGQLLQSDDSGMHLLRAKFKNIKCGCRMSVIEYKLINQPGVVFAHLEDAKEYPCVVVYDAKKNNQESIFKHARQQDDIIEVISDSPVQSIPELVQLIQAASDKPDKHIFSLWSFLPPPMELPK